MTQSSSLQHLAVASPPSDPPRPLAPPLQPPRRAQAHRPDEHGAPAEDADTEVVRTSARRRRTQDGTGNRRADEGGDRDEDEAEARAHAAGGDPGSGTFEGGCSGPCSARSPRTSTVRPCRRRQAKKREGGEETYPNSRTDAESEMSDGAMIVTARGTRKVSRAPMHRLRRESRRAHPKHRSPRRTQCRRRSRRPSSSHQAWRRSSQR